MDIFLFLDDVESWTALYRAAIIALFFFLFPSRCSAQQNLFNVPSAEITENGELFFQQQFNFEGATGSNTTVDYGLGHNLEVGANLFMDSHALHNDSEATNPAIMGNIQKAFPLTDTYKVSVGSQTGTAPNFRSGGSGLAEFSYLMNAFQFDQGGKYYLGGYLANERYGAGTPPRGVLLGFDVPLLPARLNVMGDLITGNGRASVGVLGFNLECWRGWQFSLGAQFPAPSSGNPSGVVVEFTQRKLSW